MISLTIDGKTVEVKEGTTVLRAAEQVGVTIPTLCDHPALPPYGGCRLCVVEVQGFRTPIASCTLPASAGMVVSTNTEKLRMIRKFVLTMLFSERNHFCPFCQKTGGGDQRGDCELQNSAYDEDMTHWPIQPNWSPFPVDASHPYFIFDHNRCILCRRCVRACANMVGNFTLDMENRGARTLVVADYGLPMGESSCIRCGTCVQLCPTGALIERNTAYQGQEKDADEVKSVCLACSVGCGIRMLIRDNRIIRIQGDYDSELNAGVMCGAGRYEVLDDPRKRIHVPQVRKEGGLAPVSWDEAMEKVTNKLGSSRGQNGKGTAALISSRLPVEQLYSFKQLFQAGLGCSNVASIEENLTSAKLTDGKLTGSLANLKEADCVLVIGADLVKSHQVAGFFVKRNRPNGTTIILIDPSENETETVAHYALRPTVGSDKALLKGLIAGVVNLGFSKNGASGLASANDPQTIADAAAASGIPAETLVAVSRELGSAQKPVIVFGKGITRSASEPHKSVLAELEELAHVTGAVMINPMGKANSHAAHVLGLDQRFNPAGHAVIFLALGDDLPTPRLAKTLSEHAAGTPAPFLIVLASHVSELTEMADVVLPVEMWAELTGHYLSLEGRLQEALPALTPAPLVRSTAAVFETIAANLELSLDNQWQEALQKSALV